jgi:hypothetical protein
MHAIAQIEIVDGLMANAPGANGVMPLKLMGKDVYVVGGPYRKRPEELFGVKLAQEIRAKCDVDLPIRDFSIPDDRACHEAVKKAMEALMKHGRIYVGCMGGWGRTGLFLACLAKACGEGDPVQFVRATYTPRAVETREQEAFVEDFRAGDLFWFKVGLFWRNLFGLL